MGGGLMGVGAEVPFALHGKAGEVTQRIYRFSKEHFTVTPSTQILVLQRKIHTSQILCGLKSWPLEIIIKTQREDINQSCH